MYHLVHVGSPFGFCLSEFFVFIVLFPLFPVVSYLLLLLASYRVVVGSQKTSHAIQVNFSFF